MLQDLVLASGHRVFIRESNNLERNKDASLHEQGGTRLAETAVNAVLFDCNESATFAAGFQNNLEIQRTPPLPLTDHASRSAPKPRIFSG